MKYWILELAEFKAWPPAFDKPPNISHTGAGFTTIAKDLSTVLLPAVALPVNETVVEAVTSFGSPVIAPVLEFNVKPAPDKFVAPVS